MFGTLIQWFSTGEILNPDTISRKNLQPRFWKNLKQLKFSDGSNKQNNHIQKVHNYRRPRMTRTQQFIYAIASENVLIKVVGLSIVYEKIIVSCLISCIGTH